MTKTKKDRAISINLIIIIALFISLLAATFSLSASALTATQYQTGSWNASTKTVTMTTASATATSVTAEDTTWGTTGQTTYYVVDSDISAAAQVNIYGEVHLILKRSYTNKTSYTSTGNLVINENASLHIHKATDATNAVLTVNQIKCNGTAVVIHGGTVKTTSTFYHGLFLSNGDAIIYAGEVNAIIGRDSGGPEGGGGSIKIYGGEVNATTSTSNISIGASFLYSNKTAKFSSIEIYNAKVVAKNNSTYALSDESIVGGNVDRIIIENSNVSAISNGDTLSSGSGIGSSAVSEIQITNSTVYAWGGLTTYASGIRADKIYLKNSTVTARAGDYGTPQGYGIYCNNLTVEGSYVTTNTGSESTNWKGAGYYVLETMTVLSGTVDAREGIHFPSSKGAVVIKGGNVIASNIYEKQWNSDERSYVAPVDASGNTLYGRTIALDGISDKTSITGITGAPSGYSLVGMKTVGNTICVWGGEDMIPTQVTVNGNQYKGAIRSGALNTSGTFYKAHTCVDSNSDDLCDSCDTVMPPTVQDGVYLIYDLNDYQYIKALVEGTLKNGEFTPQAKVKLMADLNIGKITIGTEDFPFRGEFDGNYHSLTVYLTNVPTGTTLAPFNYADGAAFKRLTVKGSIVSDLDIVGSNQNCINIGGFVGITKGEPVSFDECINLSHVEINNPKASPTGNLGGFVGMNYTTLTFTNCASLGRIDVGLSDGGSGVVGNSEDGCKVYLDSCYIYFTFGIAKSNIYRSGSNNNSYVSRKPDDTHITNSYYNVTQEDTPGAGDKAGSIDVRNTGSSNDFNRVNAEDIANGNLVNLLNKGDNAAGVWKQTLTGDNVDAYPNFTGKRIVWNIDGQKYDNHEHIDVYTLATVNAANDTVNVSCPVCCPNGQNVTISISAEHTYDPDTAPTATVTGADSITVVYKQGSTTLSEAPKAAGSYTASFTLGGKTASVAYTILPESIEGVNKESDVKVSGDGVVFNGDEQTLNITEITLDGVTLVEGTDFTVSGNKQTNVGTHTVTVRGNGNYTGSFTLTYTINQADINDASVTIAPIAYTGTALEPALTVIFNGKTLVLNTDYTALYANNVNAYDSPTVTLAGIGNFKGEITKSFTIDKAIPTITAPTDANRTYNGESQTIINAGTTTDGTVMWYSLDNIDWSTELPTATYADSYTVYYKVVGNDNYKDVGAQSVQVKLSPKVLGSESVTVSSDVVYNKTEQKPTVTVKDGETVLLEGAQKDYTVTFKRDDIVTEDFTNAGSVTVTVSFNGNYSGEITKTYIISKADLTLELTSPLYTTLPGTNLLLSVTSNSEELGAPTLKGSGFEWSAGLEIKIKSELVVGKDKAEIYVVYPESANYNGGQSEAITIELGMLDFTENIEALEEDVAELNKLIEENGTIEQIRDKLTEITGMINALDGTYATDAKVAEDIEKAKKDVTDAYTKAIEYAVAALEEKIAAQIDPTELATEIKKVTDLIDALDDTYATDAKLAEAIAKAEGELAKAKSDLEALINGVQSDLNTTKEKLDKAIEDLGKAIADGDKELSDEIDALTTALSEAKAALEKADSDNKAELISKIETADATLDAAIKAVQKNLDDTKAALEAKDNELAKVDAENKAALEEKDAELQTFIIIVCVMSGVALCGSGAFVVWFFIDRKKRI